MLVDYDNIIAGLNPGGSNKVYEARILICYLFDFLKKPLTKTDINNILQHQGLVNYFTFSQAFNDLIRDDQIEIVHHEQSCSDLEQQKEDEEQLQEHLYFLTSKGMATSEIFKNTIAVTVKEKISISANQYLENIKLLRDNVVKIEKVNDGYMVHCRVKDIGSDLIIIDIFSPDKKTADKIKKNFISNSLELYQQIFDFLTEKS